MSSYGIELYTYRPGTRQKRDSTIIYLFEMAVFCLVILGCLLYFVFNVYTGMSDSASLSDANLTDASPHPFWGVVALFFCFSASYRRKLAKMATEISEADLPRFHELIDNGLRDERTRDKVESFFVELKERGDIPLYGDMDNLKGFYALVESACKKEEKEKVSAAAGRQSEYWDNMVKQISREIEPNQS